MWSPSKKVVVAEPVPRGQELRQLEQTRNKHVEIQATTRGLLQDIDDLLAGRPQLNRSKTSEVVGLDGPPELAEKEQPEELSKVPTVLELSKGEKMDSRRIFEEVPPEVPQAEPGTAPNDPEEEGSSGSGSESGGSEQNQEAENEEVFDEWDDDDMEAKLKRVQNGRLRTDALLKRFRADKRVALVGQLHEWFSEHMADTESFLSFLSHESFRNDLQKEFEAAHESVKDQVGSTEVSAMLRLNSFLQKLQQHSRKGAGVSRPSSSWRRGQEEEDAQAPGKAQWFKERVAEMRKKVAACEEASEMGTKVTVNIMGAHNLRIVELKRRSQRKNFYCTCEIIGKPASKFETKVVSNEVETTWNHEAVVGGFEPGDSLRFTVLDESDLSHGDCVGSVTLSSAQILPDGFLGGLVLCVVRDSQAKLQVKVSVESINKNQVRITELLDLIAQQQEHITSLEDDYSLSQKRVHAIEEAIKYVREKQPDPRIKSIAKPKAAPAADRAVMELIREAKMEVKEEKFEEALRQNPTLRFKLMKKIETHQLTERAPDSRPGSQDGAAKPRDEKTQALEQECRDLEAEIQSLQQYMVAGDASAEYTKGLRKPDDGGVGAQSEVSDDETAATETAVLTRIQTTTSVGTTVDSDANGGDRAEWLDSIQVQELLGTIKKTVGNLKQSREHLMRRLSGQGLPSGVLQVDQLQVSRSPSAAGGRETGGEEKKKKPGKKKGKAAASPQKGSKANGGSDPAALAGSPAPSRTPSKRLAAAAAAAAVAVAAPPGRPSKQQEAEAKLEALRSQSNDLKSEAARLEARIAELRAGAGA